MMRRIIVWGMAAILLALVVWGAVANSEELILNLKLYDVNRTAKRFRAEYEHAALDIVFHPEMQPRLDVYSPPEGQAHPVLVFVHGGGWEEYGKELFALVAMRLVPENIVVVIPDYTLYPDAGYEQMVSEVAAALSWTLENIQDYGGDPQRVVVAGHSAGGHLVGMAVMDPRFLSAYGHSSDELCAMIGLSGVYDVQAQYDFGLGKGSDAATMLAVMGGEDNLYTASPISYVRPSLPPILLIHGDEDKTVPMRITIDFYGALQTAMAQREERAPPQIKIYFGAGHSDYLFDLLLPERSRLVADMADFVYRCAQ